MFVMNLTETELDYTTNDTRIRLFPRTVVEIDDTLVTPERLKACFGSHIDIIGEDKVKKVRAEQAAKAEADANVLDELFDKGTEVFKELANTDDNKDDNKDETNNVNHEWEAKKAQAKAYFEDLEQCNDSDKYKKLEIMKELMDEASKEERCYDDVSLMEAIEEAFAKLPRELVNGEKEDETEGTDSEGEGNTPNEGTETADEGEGDNETEVKDTPKETKTVAKSAKTKQTKGNKKTK